MANTERIDRRIQEQEEKLKQDRVLLDRLKARKVLEQRKADTRKKILAGAVVLRKAKQDPEFEAQLLLWLSAGLVAPRDRELFDLSAVESAGQKPGAISAPANDDRGAANEGQKHGGQE